MTTAKHSGPTYHASYEFPDGDLVLQSNEGTLFRVHSTVMKLASEEPFETLLELGNRDGQENGGDARVPMFESDDVLLAMLNIIYPNRESLKKLISLTFATLLAAAGKFHMNKVVDHVRTLMLQPHLIQEDCFAVYAIACKYGWEEEAKAASFEVLKCNKRTWRKRGRLLEKHRFDKLLDLHVQRKNAMKDALGFGGQHAVVWKSIRSKAHENCNNWASHITRWTGWHILTWQVLLQMEMDSYGSKIRGRGFLDEENLWPYLIEDECQECRKVEIYDKHDLHLELIRVLNSLPETV